MTDKRIELHVGGGFDAVSKRVTDAWHRAEKGEHIHEVHTSIVNWDLLASLMTKRRYELLSYVHKYPSENIATLAREIHRDYKRVYEDVHVLESAGLISRESGMLRADYDRIDSSIQF